MELKLFKDFDNDITKNRQRAREDLHPARKALDSLRSFQRFN